MKLRFFKRKAVPPPDFTTVEVEYQGITYGYFLNWFIKGSSGVGELKV